MASNSHQEPWFLENGNVRTLSKEMRHGRTHHYMSSSSFRRKSDLKLVSKFPISCLRQLLANLQEVILGTKLSVLFPAIPLAIAAETYGFGRRQADVNSLLLLLALLCHLLPTLFRHSGALPELTVVPTIQLSRASSIVMLLAYTAYLVFQLWTHRQLFEAQEESQDGAEDEEEVPVIGFWSGFVWLVGMTIVIALLSEYVVSTIEDASDSWGLSVSFLSIILLPIIGNAAEHAGAIIFAFKNKLLNGDAKFISSKYSGWDISLHEGTGSPLVLHCYCSMLLCIQNTTSNPRPSKCRQLGTSNDYKRSLKRLIGLCALKGHCSNKYSSIKTLIDATDLLVLQF
ncbi:hypothetical protein CMV_002326 [Castanea mollissima]|uniref:Sodium/calcium exchanger membrane region domain-containing protein n=1 Tax=Castanea mollissima TaxID=60419 RepID=A0A8J4W3S1_9ROSI|nr:hypothetical protein CMV_002326 [Castanea mollissima]